MKLLRIALTFMLMLLLHPQSHSQEIEVGAARTSLYVPLLRGKKIALLSNHTGLVGSRHTLDILLDSGLHVTTIFSPEHGFRGTADAGQHVRSSVDPVTGIPIASLYDGHTRYPVKAVMDSIDIIVVDIQDVGLRFYTYYITMIDLMNAAIIHDKQFMILDRPNPNGMTVDGPILDMKYASGVGRLPIPVLHGMTLGELANMANGEGWLHDHRKVPLTVIRCAGYTHSSRYILPVPPSPNLPTMLSVYLYPSLCYFEATDISIGRGTDAPFTIYGHPSFTGCKFSFTPRSLPGAKRPPQLGRLCHGIDLRHLDQEQVIAKGIDLSYLIDAYNRIGTDNPRFLSPFFEKLIGNDTIRTLISRGLPADSIKATWRSDVEQFKALRHPYLLYPE